MTTFRKKPVVVEAFKLGEDDPPSWWTDSRRYDADYGYAAIKTLEGTMFASVGDWIIRGVTGELYPCKPDIFEATYEAVIDQPPEKEQ